MKKENKSEILYCAECIFLGIGLTTISTLGLAGALITAVGKGCKKILTKKSKKDEFILYGKRHAI